MIGVIASPIVFWFLIGSGLGGSFRHPDAPPEVNYLEFFFPGTVVLIVLFSSIFSSISIIEDRAQGFLQSVVIAPISRTSLALGKVSGGAVLSLFQAALLLLLTPFIGIPLSVMGIIAVLGVLFLLAFGLSAMGLAIAWQMESAQGFHAIMNLFLIPLWMLSGALFPASGAAGWLHWVMAANPLMYGVAAVRSTLYLGNDALMQADPTFGIALIVTAAFAAGMFFLAVASISRRTV